MEFGLLEVREKFYHSTLYCYLFTSEYEIHGN